MKLDRNINPSGKGKYAVINLRKIPTTPTTPQELATAILANPESVEFGAMGSPDEFWLIKLKDRYATPALMGYAMGIAFDDEGDPEYQAEVIEMGKRSGTMHPLCKRPD
jgi:hypothetical protein